MRYCEELGISQVIRLYRGGRPWLREEIITRLEAVGSPPVVITDLLGYLVDYRARDLGVAFAPFRVSADRIDRDLAATAAGLCQPAREEVTETVEV